MICVLTDQQTQTRIKTINKMISVDNIGVDFSGHTLFSNITFNINENDRIALMGKNGAGKSTLLKIIAGVNKPTNGKISAPSDAVIAYLPQHLLTTDDCTVFEETSKAFGEVITMKTRIDELNRQLETRTDYESDEYMKIIEEVTTLSEKFYAIEEVNYDAEVELALLGLGFVREDFHRLTSEFSGGWRMRIELAKILLQKPLIIRTGFTLSLFAQKMKKNKIILLIVYFIEFLAYKSANKIIISSEFDKKYILKRYNINNSRIEVLYNYINSDKFYNKVKDRIVNKLVTIVRLTEQKNLFNLIEAVSKTNYILDIYGDGELKKDLESFASDLGAQVNFMGIVTNDEIIDILNSYQYFILASYYEGMPKVLLEAMSCGCICIGTDVMGINEVIIDSYNGYLSKSINSEDIKNMINNLKMNEDICANALKTINADFTLESFYNKEKRIYMECFNAR